jgi:hypothetical protein
MQRVVGPGVFDILLGLSSANTLASRLQGIPKKKLLPHSRAPV